jgi:hypothetical protein
MGLLSNLEVGQHWAHSTEGVTYYRQRFSGKDGVCFVACDDKTCFWIFVWFSKCNKFLDHCFEGGD